jgi:hypothetical protein
MAFTPRIREKFEKHAECATLEIPAKHAGARAFIGIYPPIPGKTRYTQWVVRRFEIPEDLVGQYFGMEQLAESEAVHADTLEQVEELLAAWNIDSATLQEPWKNDYPL